MILHHKNRYDRFIQSIKAKGNRVILGYTEKHHIQPRCLKGNDSPDNVITLTLREHFIAHWMLWLAYPTYLPLASAFLQMANKNPKTSKPSQNQLSSRIYEKLKTETYKLLGENNYNKVYVKDQNGNTVCLTKEEYQKSSFNFHTTGKLYVFDTQENQWIYIDSQFYQQNKHRYISQIKMIQRNMRYCFYDCVTQEIQKISKPEVRKLNKQYGYKRLQQLQKKKVKCIETDGSSYYVPLSEYNPTKHKFYAAGTLVVFDVLEQRNKKIKVSEYLKNQNQYLTSTKGKVLAKNSDGIQQLVSRKEYETGNYVGQTKGLTTVFDKETGKYTQITCSEFSHNKQRYTGPNFGKVNVINKITGERQQISKLDFDKTIYAGLGDKSQYFLCKNILTGKEKNISIYEWNKLKDLYEIINLQQFEKAKRL